jgi:hypothetical protein
MAVGHAARVLLTGLALALAAAAPTAGALEPRFDHRDQQGVLVGLDGWYEAVSADRRTSTSDTSPRLRLAWSRDVSGEGGELVLGAAARLASWSDPGRHRYLGGLDARYRGYVGTEQLKTLFEVGLWSELASRLAAGPLVGAGVAYDPSRAWGLHASLVFATGFGQARVATGGLSLGVQLRFE